MGLSSTKLADVPPMVTEETPMKFVPEMVTLVPPVTLPLPGLTLKMDGEGAMTWMVKEVLAELPATSVAMQKTVFKPMGKVLPLGRTENTGTEPLTMSEAVGLV